MAIQSGDMASILTKSLNLNSVELQFVTYPKGLRCFKCGKRASFATTGVTCVNNPQHYTTNLNYLIELIDSLDGALREKNDESIKGGSTFL